MALSLAGKTAIVTGAGSGINLSFAKLLLSKGCNVLFADLALRPEAQKLHSAHSATHGGSARAVFQKTDVTDWVQLEEMFKVADKEFGGADIVCPGAGVFEPPFSSFWHPPGSPPSKDSPSASRYAILDINLTHPIRTTQLALSHFLNPSPQSNRSPVSPQNPRHIIHVSSVAGQITTMVSPMYNASKHALNGFVWSLAGLDSIGVRVTAVAPGLIKTPLWTDHPEKMKLVAKDDEWVTPEFVAETMIALLEQEEVTVKPPGVGATSRKIKAEGGLILEVGGGRSTRKVEPFNDPGPSGEVITVGNMGSGVEEVFAGLKEGWGKY